MADDNSQTVEPKETDETSTEAANKEPEKKSASQEEINKLIEKARKEEKEKLYPQLNEVKDEVKSLQELLREEKEEKERVKQEAEAKAEKQRQAKLSDSEKTLEAIKSLEEQLKEERAARLESDKRAEEYRRGETIRQYRERAIQAVEGKLIPELVTGNTEKEIDESIELAKVRYEELLDELKEEVGDRVKHGMSTTNPDTEALEEEELEKSLSQVDQDKYLSDPEYREKIQNELQNAYEKASGRA